jgi:hypothetical protein
MPLADRIITIMVGTIRSLVSAGIDLEACRQGLVVRGHFMSLGRRRARPGHCHWGLPTGYPTIISPLSFSSTGVHCRRAELSRAGVLIDQSSPWMRWDDLIWGMRSKLINPIPGCDGTN